MGRPPGGPFLCLDMAGLLLRGLPAGTMASGRTSRGPRRPGSFALCRLPSSATSAVAGSARLVRHVRDLSCLILVAAGLPFLALQIQDAAIASIGSNPQGALSRATIAMRLQPTDPSPVDTKAYFYLRSAETAAGSARTDRGGAVLDDLALALSSELTAIQREPADWSERYGACTAALNILLASEALAGKPVTSSSLTGVGVDDWSDLSPGASSPLALPPAG